MDINDEINKREFVKSLDGQNTLDKSKDFAKNEIKTTLENYFASLNEISNYLSASSGEENDLGSTDNIPEVEQNVDALINAAEIFEQSADRQKDGPDQNEFYNDNSQSIDTGKETELDDSIMRADASTSLVNAESQNIKSDLKIDPEKIVNAAPEPVQNNELGNAVEKNTNAEFNAKEQGLHADLDKGAEELDNNKDNNVDNTNEVSPSKIINDSIEQDIEREIRNIESLKPEEGRNDINSPETFQAQQKFEEQHVGFNEYNLKNGFIYVEGPSGQGGHSINAKGFDGLAFNINDNTLQIIENKGIERVRNLTYYRDSPTAVTENLKQNIEASVKQIEKSQNLPEDFKSKILDTLNATVNAIETGDNTKVPENIKIVFTSLKAKGMAESIKNKIHDMNVKIPVEFKNTGITFTELDQIEKNLATSKQSLMSKIENIVKNKNELQTTPGGRTLNQQIKEKNMEILDKELKDNGLPLDVKALKEYLDLLEREQLPEQLEFKRNFEEQKKLAEKAARWKK